MKNLLFILLMSVSTLTFAQVPQGISYQAVAFNNSGVAVANSTVGVQVSILDNSATGTLVYTETHTKATNAQGLFNLNIGQGTATVGTFASIDWGTNSKFLKVEVDPTGGTSYTNIGVNQLMSVPYALFSENTNEANLPPVTQSKSTPSGAMIVVYTDSSAYGFTHSSSGNPYWYTQALSGNPIGAIATDSSIIIYTDSSAYGFTHSSSGNPYWYTQALSGNPVGASVSGNSIVVYTSSSAYGFTHSSSGNPYWYTQALSGNPIGASASGNSIVIYTSSSAYGFTHSSSGNPYWHTQALSGNPIGASASGNSIVIYTSSSAYGFTHSSSGNPYWYTQALSGTPAGIVPK